MRQSYPGTGMLCDHGAMTDPVRPPAATDDGTQWPSVTVVTVSFRDPEGLRRTRSSLLAQHYPGRLQHVVVDGGTGAEVSDWLANQTGDLSWVSEPDGGIYHAMNKGIAMADGDLLWFMNSADTFHADDSVRTAMAALRPGTDPREQWGFGRAEWHRPGSREADSVHGPRRYLRVLHALGRQTIPHQAVFLGASLVARLGRYEPEVGITADQALMMRCAREVAPVVLPDLLCDYDMTGVSSQQTRAEHWAAMRRARRLSGVRVTGSRRLDDLLSRALQGVERFRERRPRQVAQPVVPPPMAQGDRP